MNRALFTSLAVAILTAAAHGAPNYAVQVNSNGVIQTPTNLLSANSIPTVSALTATSAADRAYSYLLTTNLQAEVNASNAVQDASIAAKVATNEMGSGLLYSNGQWTVVSQGTVTNVSVNGVAGHVTNMIATITNLAASDIDAVADTTEVEVWSNVTLSASITNAVINGTQGSVSNGMSWLTLPLGGYATTGSLAGYATTGSLAVVSNMIAGMADTGITNITFTEGVSNNVTVSGKDAAILFKTNYAATASDSSQWATNAATTNVNMAGFQLLNLGGLSVTGRLVIGFGLFADTNDVPAASTTNAWNVAAVAVNGTNYLMGVDAATNRTFIGGAP